MLTKQFTSTDHPVIIALTSIGSIELVQLTEIDVMVKILIQIVVGTLTAIYLVQKTRNLKKDKDSKNKNS